MKADIRFLKDLQQELREQENDGNADPVFWVIRHYVEEPTWDGTAEYNVIHSPNYEYSINFGLIEREELIDDYEVDPIVVDEMMEEIEYLDDGQFLEWTKEHIDEDAYIVPIHEDAKIVPNTFFITKSDAKKHIKNNRHNLGKRPHTYAMTAFRSPIVEKLWSILENFDWDSLEMGVSR